MNYIDDWEHQLEHQLNDLRRSGQQLTDAAAEVRGRNVTRGVSIEVDATGDITSLQVAPAAMKWSAAQLATTIIDCHRKARADATTKTEQLISRSDPRIQGPIRDLRNTTEPPDQRKPPQMSEAEIQDADDAYFERMNRGGWLQ
ncbi:hypothetical protein [Nocardia sp. BMG51109]|uniref:hypothetical protein n=1 Tax=Nocardia sp. BMG51109 TaxID=1056816 RepID=UPI00046346A6|nr:hypothetical protein [Nocardia sp. BMG51109]